jgi:predicted RNase H-like HicB family nuclease
MFRICPAAFATGKTRKLIKRLIREAIEFHIEGLIRRGEPIPEPSVEADTVRVAAVADGP